MFYGKLMEIILSGSKKADGTESTVSSLSVSLLGE